MVKVQLLTTPNCSNCKKVEKMLDEMKVKYSVIDITKKLEMLKKYPFMTSPGIVINNKLEFSGAPSKEALKKKLKK